MAGCAGGPYDKDGNCQCSGHKLVRKQKTEAEALALQAAGKLNGLIGRRLDKIEVVPLGVVFHFSSKDGDEGVAYWAYGGPR